MGSPEFSREHFHISLCLSRKRKFWMFWKEPCSARTRSSLAHAAPPIPSSHSEPCCCEALSNQPYRLHLLFVPSLCLHRWSEFQVWPAFWCNMRQQNQFRQEETATPSSQNYTPPGIIGNLHKKKGAKYNNKKTSIKEIGETINPCSNKKNFSSRNRY